jgi:exonuclease III
MTPSLWIIALISIVNADCPIPYAPGKDRRTNPDTLRLVQFNAEWLFMTPCQAYGCPWANQEEQQQHIAAISNVLAELQPDLAHFAEVENCDALAAIAPDPTLYPYLIEGKDTSTHQNVGLLTKTDPLKPLNRTEERVQYPVPNSTCGYTGEPGTTGVSKHLIAEFSFNNRSIALIGAHLLAYPTDKTRCAEREAQAQVLQNILFDYITRGAEVIVLGDLNDYDAEIPDANNHKPISHVLDILKGSAGSHKGLYSLWSVGDCISQGARFSDWYDENSNCVSSETEFSQIDHILLTKYLYDRLAKVFMYQDYEQSCASVVSDHYPVVADFVFSST